MVALYLRVEKNEQNTLTASKAFLKAVKVDRIETGFLTATFRPGLNVE